MNISCYTIIGRLLKIISVLFFSVVWVCGAYAQSSVPEERPRVRPPSALTGWADWVEGEKLFDRIEVPPAPVLSPEEELKTFKLAPGYRIELVAADPYVQKPIFFEFDPDGRMWVVEYQGYMRDLQGSGEGEPICRVVVLEDKDADGRMESSTVFLDGLVMPRSLAFVEGGILLQEPPNLWFCEDLDGDLKADRKTAVGQMGIPGNPQHTANGLRYGIDNWLHCADSPKRFRWENGKLIEADTVKRGQFGLTFDETGRFFTCYQDKALYGDYIPAEYLLRNPNFYKVFQKAGNDRSAFGVDAFVSSQAQEVFPIRVTPAITLGALELRDDGTLETYTIVSGICYYNGHQFPEDARGNFFIPESGGHVLGRLRVGQGIAPQATRYYTDNQEFLASTDERFRPVYARVGPDGALYIADMYHGIIEHVIFMVPWLTKQIEERKLNEGNDLGRMWRIVAEDRPIDRSPPGLSQLASDKLVDLLSHPNGWHRLTAQRLLVERGEGVDSLRRLAGSHEKPLGQLHALWTLNGIGKLDTETRLTAMKSLDQRVRAAAIRLSEGDESCYSAIAQKVSDSSEAVRLQVALSLGAFHSPQVLPLFRKLLEENKHSLFKTAVLTGLTGRELEFLESSRANLDSRVTTWLGKCVLEEGDSRRVLELAELFNRDGIDDSALLEAFAKVKFKPALKLAEEPSALSDFQQSSDFEVRKQALHALEQLTWPGAQAPNTLTANAPPLSEDEKELVAIGRQAYEMVCAACHQANGAGSAGVAPPLAESDWVNGNPESLVKIVLHGLYGPIEVNGETWNLHMPGLGASGLFDDRKIAGVVSYIRRAWGNTAAPIDEALVSGVRSHTEGRTLPWRAEELKQMADHVDDLIIIRPRANGELLLEASQAKVYGEKLAYRPTLDVLAPWRRQDDVAEWHVSVERGGDYEVWVNLAADDPSAGDYFVLETDGSSGRGEVLSSGAYDVFHDVPGGKLTLKQGVNRLLLRPDGPLNRELADVRRIRLMPVGSHL